MKINSGPFGINSRPALIVEKYAAAHGKGNAYHQYIEQAFWLNAQDISQPEVLHAALQSVGLDVTDLQTIFSDPQYEAAVDADVQQAYQYGLSGVPAVVFNNRYLVSGAQPYDVFRQVMEKVLSEQTS